MIEKRIILGGNKAPWRAQCHDCGALEGQLHAPGCDVERCPFCGHQLITCGCWKTMSDEYILSHSGIRKKRIPWIKYPYMCAMCGKLWPELFSVPNEEWNRYIEPAMRNKVLCRECYDRIVALIDYAQEEKEDAPRQNPHHESA